MMEIFKRGLQGVRNPLEATPIFSMAMCMDMIVNKLYSWKLSLGVASNAEHLSKSNTQ